MLRNLSKW